MFGLFFYQMTEAVTGAVLTIMKSKDEIDLHMVSRPWQGESEGEGTLIAHGRGRKTKARSTPTTPGRSTSGFHRPGRRGEGKRKGEGERGEGEGGYCTSPTNNCICPCDACILTRSPSYPPTAALHHPPSSFSLAPHPRPARYVSPPARVFRLCTVLLLSFFCSWSWFGATGGDHADATQIWN